MAMTQKAVVKDVKISDIKIGDKLCQDITGMKGRTLIYTGQVISHREMLFLRKQLGRTIPRYSAERYILGAKAIGSIFDKSQKRLVNPGQEITQEALSPLLKEGFTIVDTGESGQQMFYRKNEWGKDEPWHIEQFNPLVRVETMTFVDEETKKELPDPRGAGVRVGQHKEKVA
jgi:hypothetical protein